MSNILVVGLEASLGSSARMLRVSQLLTQRELADMAGVDPEEVHMFERNLPVRLDVKRRLLKELWARRALATIS